MLAAAAAAAACAAAGPAGDIVSYHRTAAVASFMAGLNWAITVGSVQGTCFRCAMPQQVPPSTVPVAGHDLHPAVLQL
jgi:hypothetical protein